MSEETIKTVTTSIEDYIIWKQDNNWDKLIDELMIYAHETAEDNIIERYGLAEEQEEIKREFLNSYIDDWNTSFNEKETFLPEPEIEEQPFDIFSEEEIIKTPRMIDVDEYFDWLNEEKTYKLIQESTTSKIKINSSPLKLKRLLIRLFENKKITIDKNKENRITFFINSCFEWDKSKYTLNNTGSYSINFFDNKSFFTFVSLIVCLRKLKMIDTDKDGKTYLEIKNKISLANLIIKEFRAINDKTKGLSTNLRNEPLTNLEKKTTDELCKLAGFTNTRELKGFL